MKTLLPVVAAVALGVIASPALAQRVAFERAFDIAEAATLDVSTVRGKIDVSVGDPGRLIVTGAATVRVGWDVPTDALALAEQFAKAPTIEQHGSTLRLTPPASAAQRRALTVNYQVRVPPQTTVIALTDSGETTIAGVGGRVSVRTTSGAIDVHDVRGAVEVTTGSGEVVVSDTAGALAVTTASSAFTGRGLGGDLRVRTGSGAVQATLTGAGSVDVETASSSITVRGARASVRTLTRSGRTIVRGAPGHDWDVTSGSGGVELAMERAAGFHLEATTDSGSVTVAGAVVTGTVTKRHVSGVVGQSGPVVRIRSRSGSISLKVE